MRFLIDADLPRATGESLRRAGHDAFDVRDIGLGDAKDSKIAAYARAHQLCLLTGDFDFADIRNYPPHLYAGIVVLTIPRNATVALRPGRHAAINHIHATATVGAFVTGQKEHDPCDLYGVGVALQRHHS